MRKILIGVAIAAALVLLFEATTYAVRTYVVSRMAHVLVEVEVAASSDPGQRRRMMDMTIEVMNRRLAVSSIRRVGDRRLMVNFDGSSDLATLTPVVTRRGALSLHLVDDRPGMADMQTKSAPIGETAYPADDRETIVVFNTVLLRGSDLLHATWAPDPATGKASIILYWDRDAVARWAKITAGNLHKRIAVILDDHLVFAPVINEPITNGSMQITGAFTAEQAADIAVLLRGGTLPAPVRIVESGPGEPN